MSNSLRSSPWLIVFFCFGISGPLSADDAALSREAVAKRAKTATALVEARPTYGSAFCVHANGLFVTNEHVVRQSTNTITLVLNAGLKNQKTVTAKIVRRDKARDLALLKVEGEEKFEPLELGSDKELGELTELIACGFPFGQALARPGERPAVSINVGSVTSLRRDKEGELHRIQLDAALNPGNSGGPVLDRNGKVVGMVVSGIQGSGVNMAIPVSHLQRFLVAPEVALTVPSIKATNRHEAFEFTAKATSILPSRETAELELVLEAGPGKERRFPMKLSDGVYRARAVPFPAREGPLLWGVEARFEDGSVVTGSTEDRPLRVGDTAVRLSELKSLRLGSSPEARLVDGKRLEGKLAELDTLPVKVGKQTLKLDLASAVELKFEPPDDLASLSCFVVARHGGQQIASLITPLYIEGVSQPAARGEWTLDVSKMRAPDTPLAGKLLGADFKPDNVQMQNTGLSLRSGNDNVHIFLTLKPGVRVYEFSPNGPQPRFRPAVHIHMLSMTPPALGVHSQGYAMRVEFGREKDGKIPGKLYLCLPDEKKSVIAGSFVLNSE
jgi:hypothetical protein